MDFEEGKVEHHSISVVGKLQNISLTGSEKRSYDKWLTDRTAIETVVSSGFICKVL